MTHGPLFLRPVRADDARDLDAVRGAMGRLDDVHHALAPGLFRPARAVERTDAMLREMLGHEGARTILAERAGRVVGLAHLVVWRVDHVALEPYTGAHVHHLVVSPEAEGTGVAEALMEAASDWARSQGATRLGLTVYESNARARRFYDKLGFVTETRQLLREL